MRALFVANGPTSVEARNCLGWGDLATLNRALQLFDAVDLAFFGTAGKVVDTRDHLHKAKALVPLFGEDEPLSDVAAGILRATGRLKEMPFVADGPREGKGGHEAACPGVIRAGGILGRAGKAIVQLRRLGYTRLWLFGHDGGHARCAELGLPESRRGYAKSRFCTIELLKYLRLDHRVWPDRFD